MRGAGAAGGTAPLRLTEVATRRQLRPEGAARFRFGPAHLVGAPQRPLASGASVAFAIASLRGWLATFW